MQSASTKTFSVSFPSVYEHILTVRENIMGEHRKDDHCLSYVSISLEELSFYDEYKGDDLRNRFLESCLEERGTVEVIADKTLPVAAIRSDIRTARSPEGKFYYFGLVPINSEYGYLFIGDCDSGSREFYEPLFDEIWQSLQYFGNPAEVLQERDAALENRFSKDQTSTHPYILQLPVLKNLYLSGNQLQSIHPALPESLETLVISNNRFTSVPESVTRLQYLNIENNPLQQLPAGLEKIPKLNLELEKKMTLLDYTYKGADGRGTVQYDDSRFYARYDQELLQLLEDQISAGGLDRFKDGLTNLARRSVALETTEEDTYLEKGNHRFGGLPDLPPGINYPSFVDADGQEKGLQFIAQINCAAIAHLQDYLPRTGILYFFIKDQEEMGPKVLYYDGDSSDLRSAKELDINTEFIYHDSGIYTPFQAESGKYPGIPAMYNTGRLYPELADLEDMYDEAEQLKNGLQARSVSPVHSMNSYVFKQHGTPEMEAVNDKRGKPEEWMVLLRVSSDNNPGFSFWDAGEIYFVIHKSDLEKKDFSNVYCGLESS